MSSRTDRPSRSIAEAVALVALCLAVYLPGLFSTPPIDRDESRFAQASRQMLEAATLPDDQLDPAQHAGGLVVPMVQDRPRLNKPPLIYWLQASSAWVFTAGDPLDDEIWMYRIPSVLGSILAVLATWRLGLAMFDRRAALFGAAFLAVSAVVIFDAHQARADQVLLGLTTLAMLQLWHVLRAARLGKKAALSRWVLLWFVVGLGVLVKGLSPVVVILTICALGVMSRSWQDWRAARPILGLGIVAMVVLPWVVGVAQHVGFDKYANIIFDETINRGRSAKEGHAGPPGYHALLVWAVFWPGALFLLAGIAWAFRRGFALGPKGSRWRDRSTRRFAELFLIAWILPTWIFFEFYSTKLPHYVLPVYPALALLCARAALSTRVPLGRIPMKINTIVFALVGGLVPIALCVMVGMEAPSRLIVAVPIATGMLACVLLAAIRSWRSDPRHAIPLVLASAVPLSILAHAMALPKLTDLSPRVVAALDELGATNRPIACTGYAEDSLVFLTRGRIERISHLDTALWLRDHPNGLLVIRPQDRQPDDGLILVDAIEGYHFANGRHITVEILRNPEPAE